MAYISLTCVDKRRYIQLKNSTLENDVVFNVFSIYCGTEFLTWMFFCQLTFSESSPVIKIEANAGSAVNFYLPSFEECGSYILIDAARNIILSQNETSHYISAPYINRGTRMLLPNGTVRFTLRGITESDFGTYRIEPGGLMPTTCWIQYALNRALDERTTTRSRTAYWLPWQPWSGCQVTCGSGYRVRTRLCSIPNLCHGDSVESSECASSTHCDEYNWSAWSDWSECSVTCSTGEKSRYKACMKNSVYRVDKTYCSGDYYETSACVITSCDEGRPVYYWSTWSTWSTCSQSCGTGVKSRARQCQHEQRNISVRYCQGNADDNDTCSSTSCEDVSGQSANDEIVAVPLSVIVGGSAGLLFLILFLVIVVLVVKLRRKRIRTIPVIVSPQHTGNNEAKRRPRHSIVSFANNEASGGYVYDTIDDDDVKSIRDRQSVLTIDNPYVSLPKSPGGTPYANDGAMYNNTHEAVHFFGNSSGNERKISNAYLNTGSNRNIGIASSVGAQPNVPRHMSVDSVGYMLPGTPAERAMKRNKRYKQTKKK
ncbi:Thrombospondin-2 [Mactra antiquata]